MNFKIIKNEQTPKVETAFDYWYAQKLFTNNQKLLTKFWSFASRQKNCAGLACNQVAVDGKRIMERFFAIKRNHSWEIIIDPDINASEGEPFESIEGCLTWPCKQLKAMRYPIIHVSYFDIKGNHHVVNNISGFEAIVWQHELDHLNGIQEEFIL